MKLLEHALAVIGAISILDVLGVGAYLLWTHTRRWNKLANRAFDLLMSAEGMKIRLSDAAKILGISKRLTKKIFDRLMVKEPEVTATVQDKVHIVYVYRTRN